MPSIQLSKYEAEDGELPDACMRCGAPATVRKRYRFTSHPLWVYVLLPFGWIPYVVVAAVLTERIRCYTLFCPRHKNHWLYRTLLIWGGFLAILLLIVGSFFLLGLLGESLSRENRDRVMGSLCIGSMVLILVWLITIPIIQVTAIRPSKISERRITLHGVSTEFVNAVEEYRSNSRREDYDDDDDELFAFWLRDVVIRTLGFSRAIG